MAEALKMATLAVEHEGRYKSATAGLVDPLDAETFARLALEAATPFVERQAWRSAAYWRFVAYELAGDRTADLAAALDLADQRFGGRQ